MNETSKLRRDAINEKLREECKTNTKLMENILRKLSMETPDLPDYPQDFWDSLVGKPKPTIKVPKTKIEYVETISLQKRECRTVEDGELLWTDYVDNDGNVWTMEDEDEY